MNKLLFDIDKKVLSLGIKVLIVQIDGIKNSKSTPEFEKYLHSTLKEIKDSYNQTNSQINNILKGFQQLHTKVGVNNRKNRSSPEVLLSLLLEKDRFPRINTLVDIYNLVSIKTGLALGAHDASKIPGKVTLRLTQGNEMFIPLGQKKTVPVKTGEYSYIDSTNNIICRLEVLQTETTKITLNTKDVFLIIQGNPNTSSAYVEQGAKEVIDLITKFCGGKSTYLNSLN